MSFKLFASIRSFELQDLHLIETPIFQIIAHADEKAKVLDNDFRRIAGLRDVMSYEKNVIAYAAYECSDDSEAFQQLMTKELNQLAGRIEAFLLFLWFVKDNSISLEQVYGQFTIAKAYTWWTGRNVISTCEGKFTNTRFSRTELQDGIQLLLKYTELIHEEDSANHQSESAIEPSVQISEFRPGIDPYKNENRVERAISFLSSARSTPHLPQKITHYMAILECLLSTDSNEIIHKVSERTAFYLENTKAGRIAIYKAVKAAYDVRSKFVHGLKPPKKHEQLCAIAVEADNIIRRVLKRVILNDYKTFVQNDEKGLSQYFNELIF